MKRRADRTEPTVEEAARLLNVPAQYLRLALREGKYSYFGTAILNKRWAYHINKERLALYLQGHGD